MMANQPSRIGRQSASIEMLVSLRTEAAERLYTLMICNVIPKVNSKDQEQAIAFFVEEAARLPIEVPKSTATKSLHSRNHNGC